MKKVLFPICFLLWMGCLPASAVEIQNSLSNELALKINSNNIFLHHSGFARQVAQPAVSADFSAAGGQVFSSDLFQKKTTGSAGGGAVAATASGSSQYQGFASISAYQNLSASDIGTTKPIRRAGPPTPPIKPGDEGNKLPLGDGVWLLMLLALAYLPWQLKRKKRT